MVEPWAGPVYLAPKTRSQQYDGRFLDCPTHLRNRFEDKFKAAVNQPINRLIDDMVRPVREVGTGVTFLGVQETIRRMCSRNSGRRFGCAQADESC